MELIIGGAYQGKLDYARTAFHVREEEIFVCTSDAEPDFMKRCLVHYENYVRYCLNCKKKVHPLLREDAVILVEDIFCGVVSVDAETRIWREETGRTLMGLAFQADTVTRVFCGLPLRLK